MPAKRHVMHGRDHAPGGADPIPGLNGNGGGGTVYLVGNGPPAASLGSPGNLYEDLLTGDLYQKAAGGGTILFGTPILDNFNRVDENPLNPANWQGRTDTVDGLERMRVVSNTAAAQSTGQQAFGVWQPTGSLGHSEAYATLSTVGSDRIRVCARYQGTAETANPYYYFAGYHPALGATLGIHTPTGGSDTTTAWTPAAGDKIGITVTGLVARMYTYSGGTWTLRITRDFGLEAAANQLTAGYIGISIRGTAGRLDDFGGGTPATASDTWQKIEDGRRMPGGGTAGQVLTKDTATDYDTSWQSVIAGITPPQSPTPPASPVDGQLWAFMEPGSGIPWMFRFSAIASPGTQWQFVGGAPYLHQVVFAESTNLAGWVNLATDGPSFTAIRAGTYLVTFGFRGSHDAAGGAVSAGIALGNAAANDPRATVTSPAANQAFTTAGQIPIAAAAGEVIKLRYALEVGGTGTWAYRYINVVPFYVA